MVVFVLLVEQTEAFIIDHARLCEATHVSHGFRRDTFQQEAIHYCYPTNITNGKCEALSKLKEICLFYHKPYYMMSMGLPGYPWYYLYISLSLSLPYLFFKIVVYTSFIFNSSTHQCHLCMHVYITQTSFVESLQLWIFLPTVFYFIYNMKFHFENNIPIKVLDNTLFSKQLIRNNFLK